MMGVKQMGVTVGGAVAAATLPFGVQQIGVTDTMLVTASAVALLGMLAASVVARLVPGARPSSARSTPRSSPGATVRRRVRRLGAAVGGMVAAQHVVATYLTLFLVDRRDMTVAGAAALLTLLNLSGTIARLGWGWVSDRVGSRLLTMAAIGTTSIAALLTLGTVGAVAPGWALVAIVIVLGAATQGGNAVCQVAIAEEDVERAGWASGVGMAFGFTGRSSHPRCSARSSTRPGRTRSGWRSRPGSWRSRSRRSCVSLARAAPTVAGPARAGALGSRSELPDDAQPAEHERIHGGLRRGRGIHRPGIHEEPLHLPKRERVDLLEAGDALVDPVAERGRRDDLGQEAGVERARASIASPVDTMS